MQGNSAQSDSSITPLVDPSRTRPGTVVERGRFRVRGRAMFERAMEHNLRLLARETSASSSAGSVVYDVGCWDGETFLRYAPRSAHLRGFDLNVAAVRSARANGVDAVVADVEGTWPIVDDSIDVVTSNQVIEHVKDTDHFVQESLRVLRPGGTAVISTENLASWHNVAALLLGWQPFSLTNTSTAKASIGNPLSNLRDGGPLSEGWQHMRVFAYRGLVELFETHGFVDISVAGSGYYPLPAAFGSWDPRHAAFITISARSPMRHDCAD